ncbi:HAD-like domain-containing protein [Plectosphaerella plurivora]|uniref:HAD-like domain-containing protein n=1 Tax=Plectosphaerella plurivora TaxID=936078 RepID=A0A9P8VAX4_9PEZI|nr:HAD-like domain-containing protein [Plectosphaerella plurivora]
MDDKDPRPSPSPKAILFDLDNTLFDHFNSLRHAISAVRSRFDYLQEFTTDELIAKYNAALQSSYDAYLRREITHGEVEQLKVVTFFQDAGFSQPSLEEIREFRNTYRPIYRSNGTATPGSIETLCRLHENGYKLAIITNGQVEDQKAKAECIRVAQLVDHIFTSEEAGVSKPDTAIFRWASSSMKVNQSDMIMVGDSIESDIKGALNAGISPSLYCPFAKQDQTLIQGTQVPTIQHMSRLQTLLGVPQPSFHPHFFME